MLAPICLFVYNRPLHTQKVLDSLVENIEAKDSIIYIFADGPANDSSEENLELIKRTREVINNETRLPNIKILERKHNIGLANSIINGVTEVCDLYGSVIVLEDDIVLTPYCLKYFNDALLFYKNSPKLGAICAYTYPFEFEGDLPETYFLNYNSCWGWATWKRSWENFEYDSLKLFEKIKLQKLTSKFDYDDSCYHMKMLKDHIVGRNNSWAIRWAATLFLNDQLSLFPSKTLVENIGFDGSGIHSGNSLPYSINKASNFLTEFSEEVSEIYEIRSSAVRFFKKIKRINNINRIKRILTLSPYQLLFKILKQIR